MPHLCRVPTHKTPGNTPRNLLEDSPSFELWETPSDFTAEPHGGRGACPLGPQGAEEEAGWRAVGPASVRRWLCTGSYGPRARKALAGVTGLVGDRTRTVARPVWLVLQLRLRLLRPCFSVPRQEPAAGGPWTRAAVKNGAAGPDCVVGTPRSCGTMNYLAFPCLILSTD